MKMLFFFNDDRLAVVDSPDAPAVPVFALAVSAALVDVAALVACWEYYEVDYYLDEPAADEPQVACLIADCYLDEPHYFLLDYF
jgi:hypothetical protein